MTSATSGSSTRRCTSSAPHHLATPVMRMRRFLATGSQSRHPYHGVAMAPDRMRFAVLGPGGVGGLLAALLSRGGDHVVLLHDAGPREIHVESKRFGDFTAEVSTAPRLAATVDAVVVTVKATQLVEALKRVPAAALGDAVVIPFLNGIDHVEHLRRVYPADSVVPAAIRVETTKVAPRLIRNTSPFAAVH